MAKVLPRPKPEPVVVRRSPFEDIADTPREMIRAGELQAGDELPTVAQLAVANTVAVGTAHRALAALKAEGLVLVTRGRRAVVACGD